MNQKSIPTLDCMCASFRRASRALTQNYDDALRPLGLRATQFTVLQALLQTGEISQGKLGDILAIDSTTLTRTLEIMLRSSWISKSSGRDRRERLLRLADAGKVLLKKATPPWEETQIRLRRILGDKRWGTLQKLTNEVTAAVTE